MAPHHERELVDALFQLEDESYMVDNTRLQSLSTGIRYRASPSMDDVDKRPGSLVKFGQMVEGISWPDGWLLVDGFGKRRYLPKKVNGLPVLLPVKFGEGTPDYFSGDEWEVFETPQKPLGGRRSEKPEEKDEEAGNRWQRSRREEPLKPSLEQEPRPRKSAGKLAKPLTRDEEELMEVAGGEIRSRQMLTEGLVCLRWRLEKLGSDSAVDARSQDGLTPLMLAARRGNLDYCVVLMRHGANASLCSSEGKAAADFAAWRPCRALIQAMNGERFDAKELRSALEKLQPELRSMAEELAKAANARALLSGGIGGGGEAAEARERQETEAQPPRKKGGVSFRVLVDKVPINDEPSTSAEELTILVRGDEIEVFGYDQTRTWARVKAELPHGTEPGWVQIQNDVEGELIRPVE
mmetsp:Transcript_9428/g.18999  ORF Transcript_9428/g.18999 Transcript_9428/m.18999 type:complete len:410 (-) Transcript_9428:22-1251(-)